MTLKWPVWSTVYSKVISPKIFEVRHEKSLICINNIHMPFMMFFSLELK